MATSADQQTLSETSGPAAAVQRYIDAFNHDDEDGMAACFADPGFILDGMAPHVWSGPSATRKWRQDAAAEAGHLGITGTQLSLGPPIHNAVVGDAAYLAAPAALHFRLRGQQIHQTGATLTVALRRVDDDWRIAAWAWTKGAGGAFDDAK